MYPLVRASQSGAGRLKQGHLSETNVVEHKKGVGNKLFQERQQGTPKTIGGKASHCVQFKAGDLLKRRAQLNLEGV